MVDERRERKQCIGNLLQRFSGILLSLTLLLFHSHSLARDWNINPSLTLGETFSDNINLAPQGNEKSAFVTQVNPGVSINYNSAINSMNLNYRMQNLYNAGGNGQWDIFHQLGFNSTTRIVRNSLFMDLDATNSQQNIFNNNQPNSNLQGSTNRTNVTTVGVSPYWKPHFKGYADGIIRFRYNRLLTENFNQASSVTNPLQITDTSIFEESVMLNSGSRFSRITWFATFTNRDEQRTNANNNNFQNSLSGLKLHLHRKFNVFAQVGHNKSNFNATTTTNQNGVFYSFGGGWVPNDQFFVDAAYGNNSFVTMGIRPTKRMNWISTFRHNKVGTNTGNVWDTLLNYQTKRSIWKIRYFEDTSSVQNILTGQQPFAIQNQFGNTITNPVTSQPSQVGIPLPNLSNQVFTRKRGEISFAYNTGKSNISMTLFNVRRVFQVSQTLDDASGVNAFWSWQFVPRSFFYLRPLWQHTNSVIPVPDPSNPGVFLPTPSTNDRYQVAVGLTRVIPLLKFGRRRPVAARIEYQYTKQTSDVASNEFTENRVTASLIFTF